MADRGRWATVNAPWEVDHAVREAIQRELNVLRDDQATLPQRVREGGKRLGRALRSRRP